MKTIVIRKSDAIKYDPSELVYIGRPSKWGNPFAMGGMERENRS